MIEYIHQKLSYKEILNYLNENEQIFNPPLATRLDLKEYSLKLHRYATHFCAYSDRKLIGLIACYFNDEVNKTGFISSVSVNKKYHREGIFFNLMSEVIDFGRKKGFVKIKLEVRVENISVTHLYERTGFREVSSSGNIIVMELDL